MQPVEIRKKLKQILPTVQKPGRYVGGELNQVVKDWLATETHTALIFPDIYDLGVPNLGVMILYELLNSRQDVLCERAYLPWTDMEEAMRSLDIPLYSLESFHPLSEFDILGFSLPYETLYTNVLNALDLAKIPLRSSDRSEQYPLIIAGGHAAFNPEPMAPFIDAFAIGEGEEVIHEIVNCYQSWKKSSASKSELLLQLAHIPGVYVPSLFDIQYRPDGRIETILPHNSSIPVKVTKRMLGKLPEPPTHFIVPSIGVVHNRIAIEIMRGCTRGCRFCHAGMITRPVRERPVDQIVESIQKALDNTGYEEISLLSLSSSDYTHIEELIDSINDRFKGKNLTVSLPSLRIESFSLDLMEKLRGVRQGGFTLAPEAATDRMRNTINKPISSKQLLETVHDIYSRGWSTVKLYFMIGHPFETLEDIQAIADLCKAVLAEGRKVIGKRANLHIGASTFVPKPHTPFQWAACDTPDSVIDKQALLWKELHIPGVKITWTNPKDTLLEAVLSRGDRRIGEVVYQAWKLGAKFDAWQDQYRYDLWVNAFEIVGINPANYAYRTRDIDEVFPWEIIQTGVSKHYLRSEYEKSLRGEVTADCRENCHACGILPTFTGLRKQNPGPLWLCPEA